MVFLYHALDGPRGATGAGGDHAGGMGALPLGACGTVMFTSAGALVLRMRCEAVPFKECFHASAKAGSILQIVRGDCIFARQAKGDTRGFFCTWQRNARYYRALQRQNGLV